MLYKSVLFRSIVSGVQTEDIRTPVHLSVRTFRSPSVVNVSPRLKFAVVYQSVSVLHTGSAGSATDHQLLPKLFLRQNLFLETPAMLFA